MRVSKVGIPKFKKVKSALILDIECKLRKTIHRKAGASRVNPRLGFTFIVNDEDLNSIKDTVKIQLEKLGIPCLRISHNNRIDVIESQIWTRRSIVSHIKQNKNKFK